LPALDDRDQAFQRFAELRLRVHCPELIAHAGRFVANALFEHADFMQQNRTCFAVACSVMLGS